MRFILLWFAVISCSLLSAFAQASKDKGVYLGGAFSLVNVGVRDPFSNEVNFKTGEILLGYKHNPWLGLEVRAGASLQDERIQVDVIDTGNSEAIEATLDEYYSVYYRAELANEIAKAYLLLGQSSIATTVQFEDSDQPPVESSESGLSFGLGFGMWLDERMNLNIEFKNLVKTNTDTFTSVSISADYRF